MGIDLYFNNESLVGNHVTNSSASGKKSRRINFWRYSTPPSLRATSPIFCYAKHRGGGYYSPIYHVCSSPLPCPIALRGYCISHIEKMARSDGGVEKHHLISPFISDIYPPRHTGTPPISSAMSRGRVEFILLHCAFVAQKYRGDTEER